MGKKEDFSEGWIPSCPSAIPALHCLQSGYCKVRTQSAREACYFLLNTGLMNYCKSKGC